MTDEERHSEADKIDLVSDPDEIAALEARNALRQFDAVVALVEQYTHADYKPFKLRPSIVLALHREALDGLDSYAGLFRPAGVKIGGSKHEPPASHLVPSLVEELCDYVNEKWQTATPLHLASYTLWRLNWIHPFTDGNGRTARAVSYLVLCVALGSRLPGTRTVPEHIASDKTPYYRALEAADAGDLEPLESLLSNHLAKQLLSVHEAARQSGTDDQPPSSNVLH
jgi:Fic family protein